MKIFERQSKSKQKQESKNQQQKSQTQGEEDEKEEVFDSTTNITDMNDDCLEKIFEYLDPQSLFNVGVSNKYLNISANTVFKRKYGQKKVYIGSIFVSPLASLNFLDIVNHGIHIGGLEICLQFLRCFGRSIFRMKIAFYESNCKRCAHIYQYINAYCAESLREIEFQGKSIIAMERPFVRVELIRIHDHILGDHLPRLVEWFPNLRRLQLYLVKIDRRFAEMAFPCLEHLAIGIEHQDKLDNFSQKNVSNLLHLNPQLRSLEIRPFIQNMTFTFLLDIIRNNSSINRLVVHYPSPSLSVETEQLNQFASTLPSLVELNLCQYRLSANQALFLIHQLRRLNMFSFLLIHTEEGYFLAQLNNDWRWKSFPMAHNQCYVILERSTRQRNI